MRAIERKLQVYEVGIRKVWDFLMNVVFFDWLDLVLKYETSLSV